MSKKLDRTKQTAVLQRTQEQRKQQKRERVLECIKELQKSNKPLTFSNIARAADCSVSYLYKWPEITTYIHDLQQQKPESTFNSEEKESSPHSLKTLHTVSKQRIQEQQEEIQELKRQNEQLRGYVVEIFELREECERLRSRIREITTPQQSLKVVPIQAPKTSSNQHSGIPKEISESIDSMGIQLGLRLKREISQHSPEKVMLAIKAFQQYRDTKVIENPSACLLTMIRDEAEPNTAKSLNSTEDSEFDDWYAEAVRVGFCADVPKKLLGNQSGETLVRVKADAFPGGYQLMQWKEARNLMGE